MPCKHVGGGEERDVRIASVMSGGGTAPTVPTRGDHARKVEVHSSEAEVHDLIGGGEGEVLAREPERHSSIGHG